MPCAERIGGRLSDLAGRRPAGLPRWLVPGDLGHGHAAAPVPLGLQAFPRQGSGSSTGWWPP